MVILIFSCRRECLSYKAKKEDYENPSTRQLQELRLFVIRPDDIHVYFQFDSKCINYWLCKNTQHRISNSLNFQERSLLVTDLGDQNQRLGKQLAEAEEAALDLRAQVGVGIGDGKDSKSIFQVRHLREQAEAERASVREQGAYLDSLRLTKSLKGLHPRTQCTSVQKRANTSSRAAKTG